MSKSSNWPTDRTLTGATTLAHSRLGSDVSEGVLCIYQSCKITGASPSDCLILRILVGAGEDLPLCRYAVGVFYIPIWLGGTIISHSFLISLYILLIIFYWNLMITFSVFFFSLCIYTQPLYQDPDVVTIFNRDKAGCKIRVFLISLVGRVFATGPGDWRSIPRLKKWFLIPPYLTLSNIRYGSMVKWSNPGIGVAPSPTPRYSSYWKGSLRVALDDNHQIYLLTIPFLRLQFIWHPSVTELCTKPFYGGGRARIETHA